MQQNQRNIYLFISDSNDMYYSANQSLDGSYSILKNSQPKPILSNPKNIIDCEIEFATNKKYFSLNRSISLPLDFIKDGAAILRSLYYLGKGAEQKAYLTVLEWNGATNIYELSYKGKFDFTTKTEDPKAGIFTASVVDDSVWGVLSRNDDVSFAVDCSPKNSKAIKVLIDAFTLKNKYTYQTTTVTIFSNGTVPRGYGSLNILPLILANEDGDSYGIIAKTETYQNQKVVPDNTNPPSLNCFIETVLDLPNVVIEGVFEFTWDNYDNFGTKLSSGVISIYFGTSKYDVNLTQHTIFEIFGNHTAGTFNQAYNLVVGKTYTIPFSFTYNMEAGEKLYLRAKMFYSGLQNQHFQILPRVKNITVTAISRTDSTIVYALRPLDLLQQIVKKATQGRFTINSNYFTTNNKSVITCGDAIRQDKNAMIYTTFSDFFESFNAMNYMALKSAGDQLFIEKAVTVYNQNSNILDIGEANDIKLSCADEYMFNEIIVGSTNQDYRHPSGKLDFLSENSFSVPVLNSNKKLDIVSKYRLSPYDIIFMILDYKGNSTKDNSGDKSVYVIDITDETGTSSERVENFESINIISSPLQPLIRYPLANDIITYNKPTIRGISTPSSNIKIYVDGTLDGNVNANASGVWVYQINTALSSYVFGGTSGIHIVDATFTDNLAPVSSVTFTIDTTIVTNTEVIYPEDNSFLYNNKPLIYGVAANGTNINIFIDGLLVGTTVADNSCRWFYKSTVLTNGVHIVNVNGGNNYLFRVNSFVEFPLITYIGGELTGLPIINNLPLIEGVAIPGTNVLLFLDYIKYTSLNQTIVTADANGNWYFQLIPVNYSDPLSGNPVVLSPIKDGLSILSTALVIHSVNISVSGFKLNRPDYSNVTGAIDNTIFNTRFSPARMLQNSYPLLASVLDKQRMDTILYQTSKKNANFSTTLNGVTVKENANIKASALGAPIARLEYVDVTTKTNYTFAKTLRKFNDGGLIKSTYRGNDIFMLPIGSMKMSGIKSDVQEWRLLLSPSTSYDTLLNLYKNGLIIKIMASTIYHSDYNSLHFVAYDFQKNPIYKNYEIYEDWFSNRNDSWLLNPYYVQKFETTDIIKDQIITNGVSAISLKMYKCSDSSIISIFQYQPVTPAPIQLPYIVMEITIDFSLFPEDKYYFVFETTVAGVTKSSAISEAIETRSTWERTILLEASNTINKVGFYFGSGIKPCLRIEGIVKKLQPEVMSMSSKSESGTDELIYSQMSKRRVVRFGTAYGLPDYLYLKVSELLLLDKMSVEGVEYTLAEGEKITPSEDIAGHPLYSYDVLLSLRNNARGFAFSADSDAPVNGVVLVVDAEAFGLPSGSLLNISID